MTASTSTAPPIDAPGPAPAPSPGVFRLTGLLYLAVAVLGMLGFLVVRPLLFAADDPSATLANLVEHEGLARLGIALELGLVVSQALVALWFHRLFRAVDAFAAAAIAVFGMVNAVAILASSAFLATALDTALDTAPATSLGSSGGASAAGAEAAASVASDVQLMYVVSENLWGVGTLFFGMWLLPMGWCALRSGWMPKTLGRVLIGGGVGYVLSGFATYLLPDAGALAGALVVPATVGEVWMVGLLLVRGAGRPRVSGS